MRLSASVLERGEQVVLDLGPGRDLALEHADVPDPVLALPVDGRGDVERLTEALEARADQERVVGHVRGLDPCVVEELREDPLVGGDRAPAGELR
jgi:hypothetical protein